MLLGSINHVSIAVTDLAAAMAFFRPLLEFLGYTVGAIEHYPPADSSLVVNLNERNGVAFNVWQAKRDHPFDVYEPGLHHVAFNVARHEQVDEVAALGPTIGGTLLEGPGEYPFGPAATTPCTFSGRIG